MNKTLEEFGKTLISDVRDRTIRNIDSIVIGKMKDYSSQEMYKKISCMDINQKELINQLISMTVDFTLHNFLEMFESHEDIQLIINNQNLNLLSDGLAGELYTEDGWIQKYTKQRYTE